jgi:hypothetical protein
MGNAAVKMPRHKKPFPLLVLVRETPVKVSHRGIVRCLPVNSHWMSAETSLGAADTSVCATFANPEPL